jgi:gliding motility-associated-like protein
VNSVTICSGGSATLTATPSQAGGTYAWSNAAPTASITVSPTATTTYTVTYSLGGCTPAINTGTVTVSPAPTVTVNSVTICSGESTTLTATPTELGGTYAWSNAATTASITVSPTATTTYTVTYSLGSCTPAINTGTVTVNPAPTVTVNSVTICSGGSATLTATPSQAGGTYAWSNAATTASITVSPTATTTYTVTYSLGGCTPAINTGTVTVSPAPTVTVNSVTICSGGSATLTATPTQTGGTYAWSNAATTASITVSPTATTTYTVTYSLGGCTPAINTGTVTVSPAPTVTVSSVTICSGETTTLTATPTESGGTYAWSNSATTASITVSPTATTTYTVTYSLGSCTPVINTGTVTVSPAPTVTVNSVTICSGETTTLTATPTELGGTYAWSNAATMASITVSPTATTTYTVTYSLGGCTLAIGSGTVTYSSPSVSISPTSATINSGQSTSFSATGSPSGGSYSWSNGSTTSALTVSPTTTTTYTVTYNLNGCTTTATITVTVNPAVILTVNSTTICSGANTTLTATPSITGGTYAWSNGGTGQSITVNPTSNTPYTVTYTLNGGTTTAVGTVTVNQTPIVSATTGSATICTGQAAAISSTVSIPNGTYLWSNGSTTSSISVSPTVTTSYSYTYTANTCQSISNSITITITVNPTPTLSLSTATICSGQSTTITPTASPTGGTYLWSGGQTTSTITVSPTATTTYSLLYTLNGCQATSQSIITVNPIPNVSVSPTTICSGSTGNLTAVPNIGAGTYIWSPGGATTNTITVSPTTTATYNVTYTLNGCNGTGNAVVTVTPAPTLTLNDVSICNGDLANLTVVPSIPGGTYLWLPSGQTTTTISLSPTTTTSYTVQYTLGNCPVVSEIATITVNQSPQVTFLANQLSGCAPLNVQFENTSGIQTGAIWNIEGTTFNSTNLNYTFTQPGCYDVSLTLTNNACASTFSVNDLICVEAVPFASFIPSSYELTSSPQSIIFTNTSTGASTYNWIFGNGNVSTLTNPQQVFNTIEGSEVWLYAYAPNGCYDSTMLFIPYEEGLVYYIPNTFTPDGDNYNQTWKPIFTSGFDPYNFELKIYNRWGEVVFESYNASIGWDGSYSNKGVKVQDGAYIYLITYKNPINDKRTTINGLVNLIR